MSDGLPYIEIIGLPGSACMVNVQGNSRELAAVISSCMIAYPDFAVIAIAAIIDFRAKRKDSFNKMWAEINQVDDETL